MEKYIYEVRPIKQLQLPDGKWTRVPCSLSLSLEEVKSLIGKARISRIFSDIMEPQIVSASNVEELHRPYFNKEKTEDIVVSTSNHTENHDHNHEQTNTTSDPAVDEKTVNELPATSEKQELQEDQATNYNHTTTPLSEDVNETDESTEEVEEIEDLNAVEDSSIEQTEIEEEEVELTDSVDATEDVQNDTEESGEEQVEETNEEANVSETQNKPEVVRNNSDRFYNNNYNGQRNNQFNTKKKNKR